MALIIPLNGHTPQIGKNCFIAPNATIIGDVVIGDNSSIWFNAVLRGDVGAIRIGENTNIQDGVIVHSTYQKSSVLVGNNVSVGHQAILHGCTIQDNTLVGMKALIMDLIVLKSYCYVAAGAVMLEGTITEEHCMYAGIPAKKIKDVPKELIKSDIANIANRYIMYADWYKL